MSVTDRDRREPAPRRLPSSWTRRARRAAADVAGVPFRGYPTQRAEQEARLAAAVFGHYGETSACCGTSERLEIDHVNGGGRARGQKVSSRESRDETSGCGRAEDRLIAQHFPPGFQTLCKPCNSSKRDGARCRLHPGPGER